MSSNLKKILLQLSNSSHTDRKSIFSLNGYQLEVLTKLLKDKDLNAKELLNSSLRLSKAQKYRHIHNLISKKLIIKTYNCYNLK